MKLSIRILVIAAALIVGSGSPIQLSAQDNQHSTLATPVKLTAQRFEDGSVETSTNTLIDVGTFGRPSSYVSVLSDGAFFGSANVMNNNGTLVGWADTPARDSFPAFCFNPDCCVSHALQWHDGAPTDLGSLAEARSSAASWINNRGEVVGVSQNRAIDPAIGFPEERAVFWRDGQMTDLGTLGGNQSLAGAINNHGGEPSSFRPANSTRNLRTHAACCTVVANGEQSVPLTRA